MKEFNAKKAKAGNKSSQIVENLKKKRLFDIFCIMDGDNDGVISPSKINLDPFPTVLLEAFAPLLLEMDQTSATLDFEAFYDASSKLLKVNLKNNQIMLRP